MAAPATSTRQDSAVGLRVAICTDTYLPQVNGVARTIDRLVHAVESRGGVVHVVTVADPEAEPDATVDRIAAVPFWAYPQLRVAAPAVLAARRALERFEPTLIHAATPFGVGLGARSAARQMGVPLVSSYHTHFSAYLAHYRLDALDAVSWPFLRWFHNSGLRTFAPTETVRQELVEQGFANTRVWGRGVDPVRFSPQHRSLRWRESLGVRDDELIALYVGRLAPEKGIDVATAAMHQVEQALPGRVRLVMTGDGPAEQRARAMAPAGTIFTGPLSGDALGTMYASADIFVFPSATETFGNVVLEALASGLAVIAPDVGPTTEFAHVGTAALHVPGRADSLAARIIALATDDTARVRLARAGRQEALRHGWEAIFDQLVADYHEVNGVSPRSIAG